MDKATLLETNATIAHNFETQKQYMDQWINTIYAKITFWEQYIEIHTNKGCDQLTKQTNSLLNNIMEHTTQYMSIPY